MKKTTVIAVLVCMFTAMAWTNLGAEEAAKTVNVEVTGKNVNLIKALCGDAEQEKDAAFGGMNALMVKEVRDAEGNVVDGMAGKLLHYLPVASASALISGDDNAGKVVTVKGVLYKDALVIAVKEFEVQAADAAAADGDDWDDWDELGVTTMSQQQVI